VNLSSILPLRRRITPEAVLQVLLLGFIMVGVLLGLAGFVALRDTHAIRLSADGLVKEQLLMARLLNDVQVEENALTEVLHQLAQPSAKVDRKEILRELKRADDAVAKLAVDAQVTPEATTWNSLHEATQRFTTATRELLQRDDPIAESALQQLFATHDEVVSMSHRLLKTSTAHLANVDQEIEVRSRDLADESTVLLGACILLAAACAGMTLWFARHSLRRIEWQTDELNRVSWHMLQTQESTARRFAHELHDELGQSLAAVRANLTSKTEEVEDRRMDCIRLVDDSIANVRSLSQLLRPVILDDFGLDAGLRWLTDGFAQRLRIRMNYTSNTEERFHSETETHLFRIAQEALTNIARHSGASEVTMELQEGKGRLLLTIADNGCGLPKDHFAQRSLGLVGMRARARECGGMLEMQPVQPHGLLIRVDVPLRKPDPD
jgi:signal transduction histidine kinase